ncbi:MAG: PorT family protein [Bacteroidales bacterium]|nr:PorT family protein [Bacteroidales bacterium]
MQDNWQEFDRQIKSVLQDAGEKAPGRVWRAVSARLDSEAGAALWWRWAVPALVAAAVVAGLFLTGTFDRHAAMPGEADLVAESNIISSVSDPAADLVASADLIAPQATEPAREGTRRRLRSSFSGQADMRQSGNEADDTPVTESRDEDVSVVPETDRKDAGYDPDAAAKWALIEQEDHSTKKTRIKASGLYAQGGLGGNDSNISYGGNGISRMAPGAGSANAGISENGQSTYGVPFTIGLGVRFSVTDKFSLGTGLDYSLLTRSFNGSYSGSAASAYEGMIFHNVQYIGVPVNVYYNLLQTRDGLMNVYAWGGGEAEYCISNRYRLMSATPVVIPDKAGGFQFSAALGMGLEFRLSKALGLYIDPSVRYYFHGNQPKSVRTDKPFMFNFDAGLRFNF